MQIVRWTALAVLLLFSAYTVFCIRKENFWKSCKAVFALKWGKQITMDLYIGLLLFNFFVYLNEGSIWTMLAWLVPSLALGNLVPLLYFVIHFDSIVAHFA
jgi:hypothetical protein